MMLARLAQWRCASRPRPHHPRARFARSGFYRFACLLMVAVMFVQVVLGPPQVAHAAVKAVSAKAANYGQDTRFWWHASGWAAWSERFLRRIRYGKGAQRRAAPKPEPQETQEARNGRVARVEISPREATIAAGQEIYFIAVAYDANNSPVGGVSFDWDKENEDTGERVVVEERGKFSSANGRFSSAKEGNYRVKARFGGFEASAKVKVKGVRHSSGQQPIGTRTVSSRDLPQPSRSSLSPSATKDRIAKKTPSRFATRYSSAGTRAMPRLLPLLPDEYRWTDDNFWSADDPGKERGGPPGHPPDGGAGSGNFQFAAPVLSFDGRGQDLNFGLSYNSRVWHKANNEIIHDIDDEWPGPGWSLSFGKIVGMGTQNGYMIIEPDGTRRPYICSITFFPVNQVAVCKTTDGSFIDYKVIGDSPAMGGAPTSVTVFLPDGTEVFYGNPANNAVYATLFWDRNGNTIFVSYRNGHGPQVDSVADTMGRIVQFYYDSNNLPVAITGPGFNGSTRTLMRITYEWKDLGNLGGNYGFSGLTPKVRNNVVPVVKAIYYPANNTGYWFGDVDSYSAYGMLAKVIEQREMVFSGAQLPVDPNQSADPGTITPGLMTRQIVYDYPMTASGLSMEPSYQNTTETWANMDVDPAVTQYVVQENASPRRVEITRPDGVKTVMLSHNAPGQWNDGLIYQDETYNPQDDLLGKSFVQWERGECPPPGQTAGPYQYCSPRPSRVETTDERGQQTGKEFSYGPRYNQVTETREYGYGYVFEEDNTLLRKTVNLYLNDPNYTDPQPENNLVWHHIFNLVTLTEVYNGSGVRLSRTEYSYDQFQGTAGLTNTPGVIGYDLGMSPYVNQPNYVIYDLDSRGNVTTVKRYADAATLDEGSAVVEIRHYDITGNVRKAETACCMQTTFNYTLSTQYAWPGSQISGSLSDEDNQNTASAAYDFNTGLVKNETDANGRISQFTYYSDSLRPEKEISPTFAFTYHLYDDAALKITDFAHEAGALAGGSNFAAKSIKSFDGHGRVISEVAIGKNSVEDTVKLKYDQLGRLVQQSRPYRSGETVRWSAITYDFLDRPVQTTAPDDSIVIRSYNQPDPPGSSGQPGETIKVTDPWGRQRWARSDALGRMVEVAEPDPGGNGTLSSGALFTTYTYDALDRLVQVNQGAQTRSFRYDSLGRLTHQKLAERDATLNGDGDWVGPGQWSDVFTYDKRSNLTGHVDARGVKTIFKYEDAAGVEDPLNRLLALEYDKGGSPAHLSVNIPVAPNVSYAYMTTGDKKRVQNVIVDQGMGDKTMSYDSEGRLSQVVQTFTGRESYPLVTDYVWDSLNRLKESTYPKQYGAGEIRKKVEPTYDVASRIESLKFGGATYASEPVYNAASQRTSLKVGDQMYENYEYDPKTGLLTNQKVKRGTTETLLDLKYNYTLNNDANNNGPKTGQLTGMTDLKNQVRNRAYEYDKLGRLIKVKGGVNAFTNPNWYQTYSYDRFGNRSLVQHTDLSMAPVKPGSQSRSDLIGKMGLGAGGDANRIFSADEPFAALGINEGYGSITAGYLDNDGAGTPVRGGPRARAEEYGNAPSANGVGGESLAQNPAVAQPAAPQKEYRNRRGLSIVTAQSSGVVTVTPGAYQTPVNPGDYAVNPPLNAGHGSTSTPVGANASGGYGYASDSAARSARWSAFPSVSGTIVSIRLKFDWSVGAYASASADGNGGSASSSCGFGIEYSLDGGSSWIGRVSRGLSASGNDYQNIGESGSEDILLGVGQNITQVQVRTDMSSFAYASGGEFLGSESQANITTSISNIRLEVEAVSCFASVAGDRWRGEYYNNNNLSGSPVMVRNDSAPGSDFLNRDFGGGSPSATCGLGVDNFSARWARTVNFSPGLYRFTATADDGVRLYVDGKLRIDKWIIQVPTTYTAEVPLSAGNHEVKLEYFENGGNAMAALSWANIGSGTNPVITGVSSSAVANNSATIAWATNGPADSLVEYGTTTAYGQSTTLSPALVTAHSQVLSGLTAGTQYYFRVRSRDAAGNLAISGDFTFTTAQSGSVPLDGLANLSYDSSNNRINTPGYEYDPAGNQTRSSGAQQQYRYDCAGRLAQVLDGTGNELARYSYGAGNQRLMSVEGGVTKYFAWAGGNIISEYEAWGTNALIWKTSYVHLGGRLLATTSGADGNERRFHHLDRLGTRLVTDAGGTVVTEQLSMPFGTTLPFTQTYGGENSYQHPTLSNPSKKRFTSYDRSDVTTLDYAVNRFYSSQQGRFTQVDPIGMRAASLGNPQTLNMYAYCGNDPINHVDPDGLFFGWLKKLFRVILKIAAVIVTVAAVLATVWTGNPFIAIAAWKLWLGAGALWAAAYGAGKLSRILGGVAGFGGVGAGSVLTPKTFPDQSGVGAVNSFLQAAQSANKKEKKPPCPSVPLTPPDVSIDENIRTARRHGQVAKGPFTAYSQGTWLMDQVKAGAPWDYKKYDKNYDPKAQHSIYEEFGNFNYGATGAALGLTSDQLERMAGRVQDPNAPGVGGKKAGWLDARLGKGGEWPYGDQFADNSQIRAGIEYYTRKFVKKDCE
jgi:RHS repeat-associated protein